MKLLTTKLLFFVNHAGMLLYVCFFLSEGFLSGSAGRNPSEVVPLALTTLILGDIVYINSRNLKGSRVLTLFCALLALDGWYILLAPEYRHMSSFLFLVLGPVIGYLSARFLLYFLFQGSGYRFRKMADFLLAFFVLDAILGLCFSRRTYSFLYGIQFCGTLAILIFLLLFHRKRVLFVLKSERRPLLASAGATLCLFFLYCSFAADREGALENFGIYLPVLLFFLSVHGIALKEKGPTPFLSLLNRKQIASLTISSLLLCGAMSALTRAGIGGFFALADLFTCLVFLCGICIDQSLRHRSEPDPYSAALDRLREEEKLREEFADYLHDNVLQDLHAVRNLLNCPDRPEMLELASDTLDSLNSRIRKQMQDCHPVLRQGLTPRENYAMLIETVSAAFPGRKIQIHFDCPDDLFLVAPYDMLIFRIIRELLTNIYKHSDGDQAKISLSQEKSRIRLSAGDNGSFSPPDSELSSPEGHKGLISIQDRISSLGGTVSVCSCVSSGFEIRIELPMKGENSYEHFTG